MKGSGPTRATRPDDLRVLLGQTRLLARTNAARAVELRLGGVFVAFEGKHSKRLARVYEDEKRRIITALRTGKAIGRLVAAGK